LGGPRIGLLALVFAAIWTVGFGLACAWLAIRLDRFVLAWFVYGAILGPIAVILLWLAPPAWCRVCLMPSRGMLRTCWWCGQRYRGPRPRSVAEAAPGEVVTEARRDQAIRRSATSLGVRPVALAAIPRPPVPVPNPAATPIAIDAESEGPTVESGHRSLESADTTAPAETTAPAAEKAGRVPVVDARGPQRWRQRTSNGAGPVDVEVPSASPRPTSAPPPNTAIATGRPAIVATAVFYSGTVRLEFGGRYGFVVDQGHLRIVGPLSPSVVALERSLAGITASVAHGRLLLGIPDNRFGELLVFTSVVGLSADALAEAILDGAHGTVDA